MKKENTQNVLQIENDRKQIERIKNLLKIEGNHTDEELLTLFEQQIETNSDLSKLVDQFADFYKLNSLKNKYDKAIEEDLKLPRNSKKEYNVLCGYWRFYREEGFLNLEEDDRKMLINLLKYKVNNGLRISLPFYDEAVFFENLKRELK